MWDEDWSIGGQVLIPATQQFLYETCWKKYTSQFNLEDIHQTSMTGTIKADVAYGTVGQLKNENKNG